MFASTASSPALLMLNRARTSSAADVDGRTSLGLRFGFPQDLVGDRSGISLSEQKKAEQVHDGVALGPAEVAMRRLAGGVAQVEQEGGDGIWHHRALGAQHLVPADLHTSHFEHVLELRGVFDVNLQEQDRRPGWDVVILALLLLLSGVLLGIFAHPTPVSNDMNMVSFSGFGDKLPRCFVDLYALLTQLKRAVRP